MDTAEKFGRNLEREKDDYYASSGLLCYFCCCWSDLWSSVMYLTPCDWAGVVAAVSVAGFASYTANEIGHAIVSWLESLYE